MKKENEYFMKMILITLVYIFGSGTIMEYFYDSKASAILCISTGIYLLIHIYMTNKYYNIKIRK